FSLTPPPPPQLSPLSLHDALPISGLTSMSAPSRACAPAAAATAAAAASCAGDRTTAALTRGTARRGIASQACFLSSPRRCRSSRSEEHTSELQTLTNLVCRLLPAQ